MSKTHSPLEPEKKPVLTILCIVLGLVFAFGAVLGGWHVMHDETTSGQSDFLRDFLVCGTGAFFSIFFVYNAFAAKKLPSEMTPIQLSQARNSYSSVAYGPVMRGFNTDVREKSRWPKKEDNDEFKAAWRSMLDNSDWPKKFAAAEFLLDQDPDNLALTIDHAQAQGKLRRFSEADSEFAVLLKRQDLSSATRVTLNTVRLGLLIQNNNRPALDELSKEALAQTPDSLERAYLLDNLCCRTFDQNCLQFVPDADAWSQLALELQPDLLTLKGTRGAVLVELGREAEAASMLRDVFDHSEALNDKGITSLYLGICAKRAGNFKAAKKWFRRAHELWPTAWLIERIKAESTAMKQKA